MSAYTTIHMSRAEALSLIHGKVGSLTNNELEEIVDLFLEERLERAAITE